VPASAARPPRSPLARALYRAGQFFRGFITAVEPDDARTVAALLSPAELQLFLTQRPRDRRHAVLTMRHLERIAALEGATPSDELRTTALLHDVGKGPLRVEDRVLFVILEAVSPDLVNRLADEHAARWQRALWQLHHHATLGAQQLTAVGSSPRVIELTSIHHLPVTSEDDRELAWLLAADEAA
jgi:HD domain-containing protein